jgi:hypothetical protein
VLSWAGPIHPFPIFQHFSNLTQKLPVQKYKTLIFLLLKILQTWHADM